MRKIWLGACVPFAFFISPAMADDPMNPDRPLTKQEQLVVQQALTIYTLVGQMDALKAQVAAMVALQKKPDEKTEQQWHPTNPGSDK